MISWQSIMSVFNTKGTLLKWLKTLDKSLKDGVLESVTVNSVSEGVITLSFNFADGSVITTPNIDIPQGAQGEQGPQGIPGTNGTNGESFKPKGEWVSDNEYHPFDYVTYQGSSYLCTETIIDGTDAPPIDTAHWQLVAEKGDQGEPGTSPTGNIIEYEETLPTASETSPAFVQTPDSILYKKYYGNYIPSYNNVQGVWTWDLGANVGWNGTINCKFMSNGQTFNSIILQYDESSETQTMYYDSTKVYEETLAYGHTWTNKNYEKIDFGNVPQKINAESIFWELYRADIVSESVFITYEYKRICETNNVTFKISYSSQVPMGSKSYIKPYIKPQSQNDYIFGFGCGGYTLLSSFSFCGEGAVFFVWGSGYRLNGNIVILDNLTYDNAAQVFLTDGDVIELLYQN